MKTTKPAFWYIPLTPTEHKRQHRLGTFFKSRDWWLEQVEAHLTRYIRSKNSGKSAINTMEDIR